MTSISNAGSGSTLSGTLWISDSGLPVASLSQMAGSDAQGVQQAATDTVAAARDVIRIPGQVLALPFAEGDVAAFRGYGAGGATFVLQDGSVLAVMATAQGVPALQFAGGDGEPTELADFVTALEADDVPVAKSLDIVTLLGAVGTEPGRNAFAAFAPGIGIGGFAASDGLAATGADGDGAARGKPLLERSGDSLAGQGAGLGGGNDGDGGPSVPSGPPRLSIQDVSVAEAAGGGGAFVWASVVVSLDHASASEIRVDWTTVDGFDDSPNAHFGAGIAEFGALANGVLAADYEAASGTLVFAPGVTQQTIMVRVNADAIDEWEQNFSIELTPQDPALVIADDLSGTVTIVDEDSTMTLVGGGGTWAMPSTDGITWTQWGFTTDRVSEKAFSFQVDLAEGSWVPEVADAVAGEDFLPGTYSQDYNPAAGLTQLLAAAVIAPEKPTDTFSRDFLVNVLADRADVLADPVTGNSDAIAPINSYGGIFGPLWSEGDESWALGAAPAGGGFTAVPTDRAVAPVTGETVWLWDSFSESGLRMTRMGGGNDAALLGDNDFGVGNAGLYRLDGGAGDDFIDASAVTEAGRFVTLLGGDGDDFLLATNRLGTAAEFGVINDLASEFPDADLASYGARVFANVLDGGAGSDALAGGAVADFLMGGAGDDVLNGLGGDDTIDGGAGNDNFLGGSGADFLSGGDGSDYTSYLDSTAAVTVDLLAGTGSGGTADGDTYQSIENAEGGWFGDTLIGDAAANILSGYDGDDTLLGGGGADVLVGGNASDTASYATSLDFVAVDLQNNTATNADAEGDTFSGIENLTGSAFDDTLTGDAVANTLSGLGGDDTLMGGAGADVLVGGNASDTASYATSLDFVAVDLQNNTATNADAEGDTFSSIENLTGSAFGDTLTGDAAANTLSGLGGDDTLMGGAGADVLAGGKGIDTASYQPSPDYVVVDLQNNTGTNTDAEGDTFSDIENLTGSAFGDTLIGDAAANTLTGLGGDDTLTGGGGADVLVGGKGSDTASYETSSDFVVVDLQNNTGANADAAGDTFSGIENLTGSAFGDTLTGDAAANTLSGLGGDDILLGGAGADVLVGGNASDTASYATSLDYVAVDLQNNTGTNADAEGDTFSGIENLTGSAFDDTLTGDAAANTIDGGAGDDTLTGGDGADVLAGGKGIDTASYETSSDFVVVDLQNNTGTNADAEGDTFSGIENLTGSAFGDTLTGDAAANTLSGLGGDDTLMGGAGADVLAGGKGIDTASYATSLDFVAVDLQNNTATNADAEGDTFSGIENLTGSAFDDTLTGDAADNTLSGLDGYDTLLGGDGADKLFGLGGDDTLLGGAGADVLVGGSGIDTASYETSSDFVAVDLQNNTGTNADAEGDTFSGIENLTGSAFDDTLTGDAADNTLSGLEGNDTLTGGAGADYLDGGNGTDGVRYADSLVGVIVDLAIGAGMNGTAQGDEYASIENVEGSGFDDVLIGSTARNVLDGMGGNDLLVGGLSPDTLIGGAGVDTASYIGSAGNVLVDLENNVGLYNDASSDTFSGIENLIGSFFDDDLAGDAGDNVIEGLAGGDWIIGGAGIDTASYRMAGSGIAVDLAAGTGTLGDALGDQVSGIENVIGSDYDDVIGASDLANRLDGGSGTNTVSYALASAGVSVDLAAGTGAAGAVGDIILNFQNATGSAFDDMLSGTKGVNILDGGGGDDVLAGGAGADVLIGGAGSSDTAFYAQSNASVTVNLSDALAESGGDAAGDTLSGIENVTGSAFSDFLTGSGVANELRGGAGNDRLAGLAGGDLLDGGKGNDVADYSLSSAGVTVDLNLQTATGGDATGDTLASIEGLRASAYTDTFYASQDANVFDFSKANVLMPVPLFGFEWFLQGGAIFNNLYFGQDTVSYEYSDAAVSVFLDGSVSHGGFAEGDVYAGVGGSLNGTMLVGSALPDDLYGSAKFAESFMGGYGEDVIDGGAGPWDRVSYADSNVGVTVVLGKGGIGGTADGDWLFNIEVIEGSAFDDVLSIAALPIQVTIPNGGGIFGGDGKDRLFGSAFNDVLMGGNGDDILYGDAGADTLVGESGPTNGPGFDTVSYQFSSTGVGVVRAAGAGVVGYGDGLGDSFYGIDLVRGSAFDDMFYLGLEAIDSVTFDGNGGSDTVDYVESPLNPDSGIYTSLHGAETKRLPPGGTIGGASLINLQKIVNLTGSDNRDILEGDGDPNRLLGMGGDDTLIGRTGADLLDGGAGIDTVSYAYSNYIIDADLSTGKAISIISMGVTDENDKLVDIENLVGSDFNDNLTGDGNDNILEGGLGADYLDGRSGRDTVDYSHAAIGTIVSIDLNGAGIGGEAEGDRYVGIEDVTGSEGSELIIGDSLGNTIRGLGGLDTIDGGGGDDFLYGGAGNDILYGGFDNDFLDGGIGNDQLHGEASLTFNTLFGGGGADIFFVESDAAIGVQRIMDFNAAAGDAVLGEGMNAVLTAAAFDLMVNGADLDIIGVTTMSVVGTLVGMGGAGLTEAAVFH